MQDYVWDPLAITKTSTAKHKASSPSKPSAIAIIKARGKRDGAESIKLRVSVSPSTSKLSAKSQLREKDSQKRMMA